MRSLHEENCVKCKHEPLLNIFTYKSNPFPNTICDKCVDCFKCNLKKTCIFCNSCDNCNSINCKSDYNIYNRVVKIQIYLYYFILYMQRSNNEAIDDYQEKIMKESLKNISESSNKKTKEANNKIKMCDNVREMMRLCLGEFHQRPNIEDLLLDQCVIVAFKGLYMFDDFPGLIK